MTHFNICIPNYNYERYLRLTLDSVLTQSHGDLEVLVSDNASTDGSVAMVRSYQERDSRVAMKINRCNVGFFGNLGKAAAMSGDGWMNMLSSDDLMRPGCLEAMNTLIEGLGDQAARTVISTAVHEVDGEGKQTGYRGFDRSLWAGAQRDEALSTRLGADVWIISADRLLRNCLPRLRCPFIFCATLYSRELHDVVEGYSQGGIINPDKRFAWALLGQASHAVFVDAPYFSYRLHAANQEAQQAQSGALKHLIDEYVSTFSIEQAILDKAGLTRDQMVRGFVREDIALRGLKQLSENKRKLALRGLRLGQAAYPAEILRDKAIFALRALLLLGPIGVLLAKLMRGPAQRAWARSLRGAAG